MGERWLGVEDRRRFFRIDDVVGLRYRVLGAGLSRQREQQQAWREEFDTLGTQLGANISKLRREQPGLAEALNLLGKQMCLLMRHSNAVDDVESLGYEWPDYHNTTVNISASGIAFLVDQPYSPGVLLSLDFLLRPADWQLQLVGQVVACDAVLAGWYLRLTYQDIAASDQDLLVRHVLVQQSQQLKR